MEASASWAVVRRQRLRRPGGQAERHQPAHHAGRLGFPHEPQPCGISRNRVRSFDVRRAHVGNGQQRQWPGVRGLRRQHVSLHDRPPYGKCQLPRDHERLGSLRRRDRLDRSLHFLRERSWNARSVGGRLCHEHRQHFRPGAHRCSGDQLSSLECWTISASTRARSVPPRSRTSQRPDRASSLETAPLGAKSQHRKRTLDDVDTRRPRLGRSRVRPWSRSPGD